MASCVEPPPALGLALLAGMRLASAFNAAGADLSKEKNI